MQPAVPLLTLVSLLSLGMPGIAAQPDFDDLSRRAAEALKSNPAEAASLYRQAVALRPSWAEGWFYLGASKYQLKRYPEARTAFRRATSLAPTDGASWAFLGLCDEQLKAYPTALEHILKAETLGLPDNLPFVSSVRITAASIYIRSAEFSLAVQQLEPLARAGDNSPAVIHALGVSALTLPYALAEIPEPKRPLVDLAGRAMWALYAGRTEETAPLFKELAAKYPAESGVHYVCGIYQLAHDPQAAIAEFEKELQITPSHVSARVQIAMTRINEGSPAAAIDPARQAVRLAPGNFLGHVALGRALMDSKQTAEAIHEFETAIKLSPENPHPHYYLGQAFRSTGKTVEAQKEMAVFTRLKAKQNEVTEDGLAKPATSASAP